MSRNKGTTLGGPYPGWYWLIRPAKTFLIVVGMLSGLVWIIGALIADTLPPMVTWTAAVICLVCFVIYLTTAVRSTLKEEKYARQQRLKREARLAQFKELGFVPTRKFIGSARILMVDEGMGKWFVMDYYNRPEETKLHDLGAITALSRAQNGDWVPRDSTILLSTGRRLNRKDHDEYYQRTGILIILNEPDCPREYINCFKTENDVDLIIQYLTTLVPGIAVKA